VKAAHTDRHERARVAQGAPNSVMRPHDQEGAAHRIGRHRLLFRAATRSGTWVLIGYRVACRVLPPRCAGPQRVEADAGDRRREPAAQVVHGVGFRPGQPLPGVGPADGPWLFRDEDLAYANRLMQAGVPVELHVYPRGIHAGELLPPAPSSAPASPTTA
jgi:hypothetical protein